MNVFFDDVPKLIASSVDHPKIPFFFCQIIDQMTLLKKSFKRIDKLHRSFITKKFSNKFFSHGFINRFSCLIFPARELEQKTKQNGIKKRIFYKSILKITKSFSKLIEPLIKLDLFLCSQSETFLVANHGYLGVIDHRHLGLHQGHQSG